MKSLFLPISLLFLWMAMIPFEGISQAVMNSKISVLGTSLYRDWKDSTVYYYLPPPVKLKLEEQGRPSFQFLSMRYTGRSCTNDARDIAFMSLAQFTVQRPAMDDDLIYQLGRELRSQTGLWISLKPIPLRGITAELIAPIGKNPDGRPRQRIIGSIRLEENQASEWEEKTFTLKLDPHEAQLLIDQLEQAQLAISFSYSYLADGIPGEQSDMFVGGDSTALASFEAVKSDTKQGSDTTLGIFPVYSNTLPIQANVQQWPQNLKKLDVNSEGFPSGFPSIEVRCYDFADGLRPDLAIKRVSLQAFTLEGALSRPLLYQFRATAPQASLQQVNFPVAIDMNRGYRYKVTEITEQGEISESNGWTEADFCAGMLDLTTDPGKNPIEHKTLEVEVDPSDLSAAQVSKATFLLDYSFGGERLSQRLVFGPNEGNPFQSVSFAYVKSNRFVARVVWEFENGEKRVQRLRSQLDDYYFLGVPE